MNIIKKIVLDVKIYIKLYHSYPKSARHKRIRSILPNTLLIGDDLVIESHVTFSEHLTCLGDHTYIGENTFIDSVSTIGKFCSISRDVRIGLISHPLDYISTSPVFYSTRRGWVKKNTYNELKNGLTSIGNDVLISAGVTILAGVKIGNGAVIGAGSFINRDIPPYAIVAGSPGKIIRYRFSEEQCKALEKSAWWDLGREELLTYEHLFNNVPEFIQAIKQRN